MEELTTGVSTRFDKSSSTLFTPNFISYIAVEEKVLFIDNTSK